VKVFEEMMKEVKMRRKKEEARSGEGEEGYLCCS
jgi:hypothetical protein